MLRKATNLLVAFAFAVSPLLILPNFARAVESVSVPSAPNSVSVIASASSLNVKWATPTDLAGRTVTNYQVEYSTTGNSGWTVASSTVSSTARNYSITGLSTSNAYYVRVAAKFSGGIGSYGYPWTKIYGTTTPYRTTDGIGTTVASSDTTGYITYTSGFGLGGSDAQATYASANFSRVRYLMKATYGGQANYVDADFAKTLSNSPSYLGSNARNLDSVGNLRIPAHQGTNSSFAVQGDVTDLTVTSNVSGVTDGNGFSGRLELWPWNYNFTPPNELSARSANNLYDDADTTAISSGYGSFQLHNTSTGYKHTVFAWNRHSISTSSEIGFGNYDGGNASIHSDWTFCVTNGGCTDRSGFSLETFINIPVTPLTGASGSMPASLNADNSNWKLLSTSGTTPSVSGFSGTVRAVVTSTNGTAKITTTSGLTAPTGYSSSAWSTGSASLGFEGTQANVNNALATLNFKGTTAGSTGSVKVSAIAAGSTYNPDNGHYYEVINHGSVIAWDTARANAKSRVYNGLTGYLATITSQTEHDFLYSKTQDYGWIGGSDRTTMDGESFTTNQVWKWVDGPEAGKTFYDTTCTRRTICAKYNVTTDGVVTFQGFNYFSDGEPNGNNGAEDFAEFGFGASGGWNDCQDGCNRTKYIVEYGGMGETPIEQFEATTTVSVAGTPSAPTITSLTAGNGTITVNLSHGNDYGTAISDIKYALSTNGGSTWGTTTSAGTTGTSFTISGLSGGSTYTIKILETNSYGDGAWSSTSAKVLISISYNSNASQFQTGVTTGSLPSSFVTGANDNVTVAGQGTLARQGFVFNGWNTAANGSGTAYLESETLTSATSVTLYAQWTIPSAARLFGQTTGGVRKESIIEVKQSGVSKAGNFRGLTTDGTYIYFRPNSGDGNAQAVIRQIRLDGTFVADHAVAGLPTYTQAALAYSNGCIFIRQTTSELTKINCVDVSTWTMNQINLPVDKPLFSGKSWLLGNMIDFPDGRVGAVSAQQTVASCPVGMYCKVLRLYRPTGTGSGLTLAFDEDIVLTDTENSWPDDDHGIATDGTYLYEINLLHRGYKVWALRSGEPSYLVFNGDGPDGVAYSSGNASTYPCGANDGKTKGFCNLIFTKGSATISNPTFITRSHSTNQYIIGDYEVNQFIISEAATPPAGPGSGTSYSVTYDSKGGSSVTTGSYVGGNSITEPSAPTKRHNSFFGWALQGTATKLTFPYTPATPGNLTLDALWTSVPNTAPSITSVVNKYYSTTVTPNSISLVFSDDDSTQAEITISATSSDQTIIANSDISAVVNSSSSGTISITPKGKTGSATITVSVTDFDLATTTSTFTVTIFGNPSVPRNVGTTVSGTTATVSWSEPENNGGSAIARYIAYATPTSGTTMQCATLASGATPPERTCDIAGLDPGKKYVITVVAENTAVTGFSAKTSSASTDVGMFVPVKTTVSGNIPSRITPVAPSTFIGSITTNAKSRLETAGVVAPPSGAPEVKVSSDLKNSSINTQTSLNLAETVTSGSEIILEIVPPSNTPVGTTLQGYLELLDGTQIDLGAISLTSNHITLGTGPSGFTIVPPGAYKVYLYVGTRGMSVSSVSSKTFNTGTPNVQFASFFTPASAAPATGQVEITYDLTVAAGPNGVPTLATEPTPTPTPTPTLTPTPTPTPTRSSATPTPEPTTVQPTPEPSVVAAPTPEPTIDERGLEVIDPVADAPEEVAETTVTAVTLVAAVTAAASAATAVAAAAGAAASAGAAATAGGAAGSAAGGSSGGSSSGGARSSGGSSSGGSSSSSSSGSAGGNDPNSEEEGEGSVANIDFDHSGLELTTIAWGDGLRIWRYYIATLLDKFSHDATIKTAPVTPLVSKLISDGAYLRSMFGVLAALLPASGIALGLIGLTQTGGQVLPPSALVVTLIAAIGVFDAMAGFLAMAVFSIGLALTTGLSSAADIRMMLGLFIVGFGPALLAGAFRGIRKPASNSPHEWWERVVDLAVAPFLGGWAMQGMVGALPALAGVKLPLADSANTIALTVAGSLIIRVVLEELTAQLFPSRLNYIHPTDVPAPHNLQKVLALAMRAAIFWFVAGAFIGTSWHLYVGTFLFIFPSYLGLLQDRFPNYPKLYQLLPAGLPGLAFTLLVASYSLTGLTAVLGATPDLAKIAFVVLPIPSVILSVLGMLGREPAEGDVRWYQRQNLTWLYRIGGIAMLAYTMRLTGIV